MTGRDDDIDDGELSPSERRDVRKILQSQERAQWLWSMARIWATWIAGGLAFATATVTAFRTFFGKSP